MKKNLCKNCLHAESVNRKTVTDKIDPGIYCGMKQKWIFNLNAIDCSNYKELPILQEQTS